MKIYFAGNPGTIERERLASKDQQAPALLSLYKKQIICSI